jgi:two-component system, NarL family, response regulator NreC
MAGKFRTQNSTPPDEKVDKEVSPDILSDRECQVLKLLSHGFTCREIGEKLFLSTSTIETYKRRIGDKLHLANRKDIVEYAIRHRIFDL